MQRAVLPALVLLLAGCAAPPAGDEGEWYLGGSFTAERTQADIDAVCDAGAGGSECALMESYPEQFGFRFASLASCQEARAEIAAVPHTIVRECVKIEPSADSDAPTSTNASPGG